jgi:hypothetical protein
MGKIQELLDKQYELKDKIWSFVWPFFYIWFVLPLIPSLSGKLIIFGRKDESITSTSAKESSWIIPYLILGFTLPIFVKRVQEILTRKPMPFFKYINYYPYVYFIQTAIYLCFNPFNYLLLLPALLILLYCLARRKYFMLKESKSKCCNCGAIVNITLNSDEDSKHFCMEHGLAALKQSIIDKKSKIIYLSPSKPNIDSNEILDFITIDEMKDYEYGDQSILQARALLDYCKDNYFINDDCVVVGIHSDSINYNEDIDKLLLKAPNNINVSEYNIDQFIDCLNSLLNTIKDTKLYVSISKPTSKYGLYIWYGL